MAVNWDVIRRKGESGELNANETDALVTMAEYSWEEMEDAWAGVEDTCPWCYQARGQCCDACPVDVLERVEEDEPDIWYGPHHWGVPECDPAATAEGKRRMLDAVERKFRRRITRLERLDGVTFNVRQGGNCERIEEPVEGCFDVYGFREGVMLRVYREPGMVIEIESW